MSPGSPALAHGFYVTSEESTVLYKCTDYYCPEYESGHSNWADPELAIAWPLMENIPLVLSDKDRQALLFTLQTGLGNDRCY